MRRKKQKRNNGIYVIGIIILVVMIIYTSGQNFSIVPIGTICQGNQTLWSSCPVPQPPANIFGTIGNLSWASATANGAILANGQINTGTAIYFATIVSATSQNLEKPLGLTSSDVAFYEYGLVQGTYCNINVYFPANYTQPYASILAIEENNASKSLLGTCGAGDLATFANNYISSNTPASLLGETAQISISPAAIATNYTGNITFYMTGLIPGTPYQLVSSTPQQDGSMSGITTQTSSAGGTITFVVPAYDVISQTPQTYTFSLLNSNTGDIQYASTQYIVSNSPVALPTSYKLTLNPSTGGYITIFNTTADTATPVMYSQSQQNARGLNVTLVAQPFNSYKFIGWVGTGAGSYSGTNSTITVKMFGNITETANYALNATTPNPPSQPNTFTGLKNIIVNALTSLWNLLTHL